MPTYDYKCAKCGYAWELYQSITAKPEKKCPSCGGRQAKRLIGTGAAIIFKGSGFYQTDYRSDSYKSAQKADSKTESSSSTSSTPSSDSSATKSPPPEKAGDSSKKSD